MKLLHILLPLILPLIATAQNTSAITITANPDLSYRWINTDSKNDFNSTIIDLRNDREKPRLSYHFGISFSKEIKPRLWFNGGLQLASLGYIITDVDSANLQWGSQHNGQGGFDPTLPGDPAFSGGLTLSSHYLVLEAPVTFRKTAGKSKWATFIEAGFSPGYILQTTTRQKFGSNSTTYPEEKDNPRFNRFHLSAIISGGIQYPLNGQFTFFVQPTFSMMITRLYDAPVKERLYRAGLGVGVRKGI